MAELIVSVLGLAATVFIGWILAIFVRGDDFPPGPEIGIFIDSVLAIYFLVRFIHWCWATPIPFLHFVG